jgi:hypothetical protein
LVIFEERTEELLFIARHGGAAANQTDKSFEAAPRQRFKRDRNDNEIDRILEYGLIVGRYRLDAGVNQRPHARLPITQAPNIPSAARTPVSHAPCTVPAIPR